MNRIASGLARLVRLALLGLLLLPAGSALAGDTDIGCGPGTQIWDGNSGVAPKVLGATTNGSFGLQTFGITFGTLGCNKGGTVTADARLRSFAAANLDRLARDMARGEGEVLSSFAHLMGVAEADRPAFGGFAKQHFAEIFSGDSVTEREVLASLTELMSRDGTLSVYIDG
jgi:hypothetical protein